ncbi:MAG: sugar ABC transporter permease, partial [Fimbriimonadaceae bacterium]|nr:sugar ABC transporter permease [Fimbriimonadaceae bacterium]
PPYNWTFATLFGLVLLGSVVAWVYWPERKKPYTSRQRSESRSAYLFISPWLIGLFVFTLGPMVLSLLMSMADWDIITPARWRGADNFTEAFTVDPRFWKVLTVTTVYTVVSIPLGLLCALGLALLLNVKVKGMPLFRTFFYLPSLASAVAGSLIWKRVFQQDGGLLNLIIYGPSGDGNFLGLASLLAPLSPPHQQMNWLGTEQTALPSIILMSLWGVGGGMVILLAGLQGIPQFYYEAATLDGAGTWQRFKAVTWPLLTPSIFFSLITGLIGSFQVFAQALIMTNGGPNDSTRFFMLHLYEAGFRDLRMGYASALAWILFGVILIFTLFQMRLQRYVYYESGVK